MMFLNKLPITPLGQQWMDDGIPPDNFYHDFATGRVEDYLTDDLYGRYCQLINWMIYESFWDQCVRQPQVSSAEYQFVVDYLETLESECDFIIPVQLSCYDFPFQLKFCDYSCHPSRYPEFVYLQFKAAGIKINPTNPLDDERHPLYNEWEGFRQHRQQVAEQMALARKPKPVIQRVVTGEIPDSVTLEE